MSANIYQVLIHEAVWPQFREWLDERGIVLSEPQQFSEDDLPTYVMIPKELT